MSEEELKVGDRYKRFGGKAKLPHTVILEKIEGDVVEGTIEETDLLIEQALICTREYFILNYKPTN